MKSIVNRIIFTILILLCLNNLVSSPVALILGFIFTLLIGNTWKEYVKKIIPILLKISVIGLGFGMYLMETLKAGKEGFSLTLFTISITFITGLFFTRLLKIEKKLGHLISSGTSICGGSAIAAISPAIKANPKTISLALGVVFLLNSIALLVFPAIGHFFHMTQHQFGMWAAVAIHDTSSVVGAALNYGEESLKIATTVKLARTLWIIPISFASLLFFKNRNGGIKMPWFILLFVLAILTNTYLDLPLFLTESITEVSKRLLLVVLFLVGTSLSVQDIKQTGTKPFILGTILWLLISISSLVYILN